MSINQGYWNELYLEGFIGWDLGQASPPLIDFFKTLDDTNIRILIPGCGNAYEAKVLYDRGFHNTTLLDWSAEALNAVKKRFGAIEDSNLVCEDFFEHRSSYDLIIEQTFFCAIEPSLREHYAKQASNLLKPDGVVAGVLFRREFEQEGPPWGGTLEEYKTCFNPYFNIETLEPCYNSIAQRAGNELFIKLIKKHA